MTGILSDQPVTRTDEFEGRMFPVRQGAEQEYWQCDRCSRNYATIVAAARCANPNHSQLFGPRPERHAEPDLAAKANGGVRVGDEGEVRPEQAVRRGRPAKHTTDDARKSAVRASNRKASARTYGERVAEKREAWQDHVAAVQEIAPANGRITRWTDEQRKKHAEAMRRHHEQRRAAKAAATPPPEKEHSLMPEPKPVSGKNNVEWTPERRAAHGERMKRVAAERKAQAATSPAPKPKPETVQAEVPKEVATVTPHAMVSAMLGPRFYGDPAPHPSSARATVHEGDAGVADVTMPDGRTLRVTDPAIIPALRAIAQRIRELERSREIFAETFGSEVRA